MKLSLSSTGLSKNKKVFLFTKKYLGVFYELLESFDVLIYETITPQTIENLSSKLYLFKPDLIIVELQENHEKIYNIIESYKREKKSATLMTLLSGGRYEDHPINISNKVVTSSITKDELELKLFELLRDMHNAQSIDAIKGTYENSEVIEVNYITDKLDEVSNAIDSGDISQEVFSELLSTISEIETLFGNYLVASKKIRPTLKEFTELVGGIDLENIDLESLDGFEYISRIIEDISVFLKKYFIYKDFSDIYIVEDSLKSSIDFMRSKFYILENQDNSEVEFF